VRWWDSFYADLTEDNVINRFDRFTTANASAPATLLSAVGGFDEGFATYGLEDFELGVRLLAAGTTLRLDPDAVAWHPDIPPMSVLVGRQRSLGFNAVRLARLHPETVDVLFPIDCAARNRLFLRALRLRRSKSLMTVSRLALTLCRVAGPVHAGTARRAEHLSRVAAHAAGVADADAPLLLERVLGYPPEAEGKRRASRARRRDSRRPRTSPTNSGNTISR
jgi:hypothetical protein